MKKIKESIGSFMKEEEGVGVVELILILAILICLVVVFKGKIKALVSDAYTQLDNDTGSMSDYSDIQP